MATGIDKIHICSMALRNIGVPPIQSFKPGEPRSVVCKDNYEYARSTTLEGALWNFASGWQTGVELDIEPKPSWEYVYAYPIDALKIFGIQIDGDQQSPSFEITDRLDEQGKLIHTNQAEAVFIYVRDKEDVSTFTWEYITALSWTLSALIVMPLTKDKRLLEKCEKNASTYISIATAATLNENVPESSNDEGFHHQVR